MYNKRITIDNVGVYGRAANERQTPYNPMVIVPQ